MRGDEQRQSAGHQAEQRKAGIQTLTERKEEEDNEGEYVNACHNSWRAVDVALQPFLLPQVRLHSSGPAVCFAFCGVLTIA
ncbi:hypothetical protein NDU88_003664 [Pleurodeles waltl]|uniref:Uncharacterized protein n=1 Tax=Pleurodeles waltl TaxID=8319 RepID=A0AAV7SGK8_PLEWA|nr:hypothetical protein NDU88_003664 [Pleurodeles waltl]